MERATGHDKLFHSDSHISRISNRIGTQRRPHLSQEKTNIEPSHLCIFINDTHIDQATIESQSHLSSPILLNYSIGSLNPLPANTSGFSCQKASLMISTCSTTILAFCLLFFSFSACVFDNTFCGDCDGASVSSNCFDHGLTA